MQEMKNFCRFLRKWKKTWPFRSQTFLGKNELTGRERKKIRHPDKSTFTRHLISNELLHTWLEGLRVGSTSDPAPLPLDDVSKL